MIRMIHASVPTSFYFTIHLCEVTNKALSTSAQIPGQLPFLHLSLNASCPLKPRGHKQLQTRRLSLQSCRTSLYSASQPCRAHEWLEMSPRGHMKQAGMQTCTDRHSDRGRLADVENKLQASHCEITPITNSSVALT